MTSIPLATSDWRRATAEEPIVKVQNRFFEQNPTNLVEGSSLISRPGMRHFGNFGALQTTGLYTQESAFNDDLFRLSILDAQRIASGGVSTSIVTSAMGYDSGPSTNNNKGTFTGSIGDTPPYFFFTGGGYSLWVYGEQSFAQTTLNWNPAFLIVDNTIIQLGNVYYQITTTGVDTGTPAGTLANPWKVRRSGVTPELSMQNLRDAVLVRGQPGVDYSTATLKNPLVNASTVGIGTMVFYANIAGVSGNGINNTTSGDPNVSFVSGFAGGGILNQPNSSRRILLPDDSLGDAIQAVATVNGYVLVVVNSFDSETSGRFYWIEPGETWIDPLNFATAELKADRLVSVRVIGDQIWFLGADTIEVWTTTGDVDFPFRRVAGRAYNLGVEPGTDILNQDTLIFVGNDKVVYRLDGSQTKPISNHSQEDQIRKAILAQEQLSVWTAEIDGHFMYGLRLGGITTLVYDLTTDQWSTWLNYDSNTFKGRAAVTWNGILGTPNIMGDFSSGDLWYLDPDYRVDDMATGSNVRLIPTVYTCGVPMRMRETTKTNELYVTGSVGNPAVQIVYLIDPDSYFLVDGDDYFLVDTFPTVDFTGDPASIGLEISDDNGRTWITVPAVTANTGEWNQEIVWRSLGHIHSPGRIFRFSDYNAMQRIDGVDMR